MKELPRFAYDSVGRARLIEYIEDRLKRGSVPIFDMPDVSIHSVMITLFPEFGRVGMYPRRRLRLRRRL